MSHVSSGDIATSEIEALQDVIDAEKGNVSKRPPLTTTGKIILGIAGSTFLGIGALTTPFLLPALRKVCLPYVPATTKQVSNVVKLLEVGGARGQQRLVDLGSGDGRVVIAAAGRGLLADGVELNPWLVWYSRLASLRQGTARRTRFYTRDLFKVDLAQYDHVVVFGVPSLMGPLQAKLRTELGPGATVIACRFPFEDWAPEKTVEGGVDTVWLYQMHVQQKS